MHRDEAKKILALYRPGVADEGDPRITEALELAQRDPELAAWFDQHCAVFNAIRSKLKAIPVPENLRKQILVGHIAETRILPLTNRLLVAMAVAAVVLLGAIIYSHVAPNPENRFDGYRNRMAKMVQRFNYPMEMVASDQTKIREYFHSKGAPDNYVLPKSLDKLPGEGGMVLKWNNHQVSLLCLKDPAITTTKSDLYLFMANSSALPGAPLAGKAPEFKKVNKLTTMTWVEGGRVYLLAGSVEPEALHKYIE